MNDLYLTETRPLFVLLIFFVGGGGGLFVGVEWHEGQMVFKKILNCDL